jgi:hypothetical protein
MDNEQCGAPTINSPMSMLCAARCCSGLGLPASQTDMCAACARVVAGVCLVPCPLNVHPLSSAPVWCLQALLGLFHVRGSAPRAAARRALCSQVPPAAGVDAASC